MAVHRNRDYSAEYWRYVRRAGSQAVAGDFCLGLAACLRGRFDVPVTTAGAVACSVYARMCDPQLRYHTPLHVLSILSFAERHRIALAPWQELAIWFHDAVYRPQAAPGENEELSALLARALLTGLVSRTDMARVERGVRATAMHMQPMGRVRPDERIVLDLDVCNFAWDRRNFAATGQALADEVIPLVGPQAFRAGRQAFLSRLIGRGFIYRSPRFRAKFESVARANIVTLLDGDA